MSSPTSDKQALFGVKASLQGRTWLRRAFDPEVARAIKYALNIEQPLADILAARGQTAETAATFLAPSLSQLVDPFHFRDMDKAVARVMQAITAQEPLAIFGDYDVDGATSSAVLCLFLRSLGVTARTYIPDRFTEGYGPKVASMQKLAAEGIKVCITVDCGTAAFDALEAAAEVGLDVVVIDHHNPGPHDLPRAVAVVNPVRADETGQHRTIAAVGMTFMFCMALRKALRESGYFAARSEPNLRELLDLVALGTVADVVQLTGQNRILVREGLKVMQERRNLGLAALCAVAGLGRSDDGAYKQLNAGHLGFQLGPRVNAGGRVAHAGLGVELLTLAQLTPDERVHFAALDENPDYTLPEKLAQLQQTASTLAAGLDGYNLERRAIEARIVEEAMPEAEAQAAAGASVLIVANENWTPGVIGVAASRVKERFNRPSIVIGAHEGAWKGSARSVPGVDIGAAIIAAKEQGLLLEGGGHPMAGGLSLDPSQLVALRAFLNAVVAPQLEAAGGLPPQMVDAVMSVGGIDEAFIRHLEQMEPFGQGNPRPVLVVQSARITYAKQVGESTVKCTLADSAGHRLSAIAFRALGTPLGDALLSAREGFFHVLGQADLNTFRGRTEPQFVISDMAQG